MPSAIPILEPDTLSQEAFAIDGTEAGEQKESTLLRDFRDPGNRFRGKPFWSWNGKLVKEELLRQTHIMREMGFGGHFMHSRVGLETDYLGPEWFDLINTIADESAKLGLEAWLYDEDRWPSGSAGGIATRDERFRMRYLRLERVPAAEFRWSDDLLAAFDCDLGGINFSRCRRLSTGDQPRGTTLRFRVELMEPSGFYNGAAYLDTMNPAATQEFIRVTHEQYVQHCGDRLGTVIKGVFTDEPHRGSVMSSFSPQKDSTWATPWSDGLPEAFRERFGYDILDHLPEIFLRREGQRLSQVKWHYVELMQQLFLEGFLQPINAWCEAHGLVLTGHVLHEDNLVSQVVPNGAMMRNYEHMTAPGIDILTESNRNYWAAKQLQSVARQTGKKLLLSELYGCTGWQMNFESHKAAGDWQALFGINLRCHHLSWFTMKGEAKRDYPASIFYQSAWYRDYRQVEDYFSRFHVVAERGEPLCDLLVLHPIESVWAQIHHGWVNSLVAACPAIRQVEETFAHVFHWLQGNQIDFDYGDEDLLRRLGKVTDDDLLNVGEATYEAVLVAGLETIRASTLDLLERFVDAGGRVIFAGEPPTHVDALPSTRAAELAVRCDRCPLTASGVEGHCRFVLDEPPVAVRNAQGFTLTDIFCQAREEADSTTWVIAVNTNRESWHRQATIRLRGHGEVEQWDCQTGERLALPSVQHGTGTEVSFDFPPSGQCVLRLVSERDKTLRLAEPLIERRRSPLNGPFPFTLDEPNVCVLDRARWRIGSGEWQDEAEILKIDHALRQQFGLKPRSGEMLQPWYAKHVEHPPLGTLELAFDFEVDELPTKEIALAIELPEQWTIQINDTALDTGNKQGWWVDTCFDKLPVPVAALRTGRNEVRITAEFRDGLDLEALYLLGSFGVTVDGTRRALGALPSTLSVGDVTTQGLPFYGGRIRYGLGHCPRAEAGERVFLDTPGFEAACLVIHADGQPVGTIAWQPYEAELTAGVSELALEVVLTRRNTFGPLHETPLRAWAYGPGNFRTTGKNWTEKYVFYPAGLLQVPAISFREPGRLVGAW